MILMLMKVHGKVGPYEMDDGSASGDAIHTVSGARLLVISLLCFYKSPKFELSTQNGYFYWV